jgi:two-component system invasion response regulator UvrY
VVSTLVYRLLPAEGNNVDSPNLAVPDIDARPVGVLIVDDQPPFRDAARTVVSVLRGWHVVGEVGTGEDAVTTARAAVPGIVLMDINLPGMNGIEATRQILAEQPSVRVVLLSTYAADDLPADALACGAVAYVRKEDLSPRVLRQVCDA